MKRLPVILGLLVVIAVSAYGQETYFGKNKVRYKDFEWRYIQSRHFDIYFYENAYPTAKFTATVMESAYVEISNELNYKLQDRLPVFVYNSHNDFQQTNIISSLLPEGVGGFTEAFKNRIVIPFDGSYEDFRHVLHHELTHGMVYNMLYGKLFTSLLTRRRLFNVPLWYAEGYAEYSSRHGWDYFADMYVRDATINGYLTPPMYLGGFLAYKQGQAMVKYIAEKYGEDKLGEILQKGRVFLTMNKALKETIGITEKELWEDFSKEMKRRYWPEIAGRKEAEEIGKQLTKARKDGSYFNEKPTYHPHGDKMAIFTDKSDYTEIVMIDPKTGEHLKSLVESQRSGDLESLHSFVSGMTFSPEGENMAFVAKSDGKPTLMFYNLHKNKIYKKKPFEFYNIISPSWSPDGKRIAFAALRDYKRDIYVYYPETDELKQVTDDRYDDKNPTWMMETNSLIFSSDRPHPTSLMPEGDSNIYVGSDGAYLPGDFNYGFYNLFSASLDNNNVTPLDFGPGQNKTPAVSPDGKKVAFISNRNGIDNIYIGMLETNQVYPVTDILTGVFSLSWSPDGKKLAFSAFNNGAFDIFVMKDIAPVGEDNLLAVTDFVAGNYDLLKLPGQGESDDNHVDSPENIFTEHTRQATSDSVDVETETDSLVIAAADDSASDSVITESGIYDEGFVFVSEEADSSAFDSLLIDIPGEPISGEDSYVMEEPALFDSIDGPNEEGDYEVHDYKVKFTPDYVGGGVSYDTFFGLRGTSYFVFTDFLGNHQFYVATDLVNTIDQSNIQLFYFYNKRRTKIGLGLFHTKNFYLEPGSPNDFLFSDRFYGFQGLLSYPFSTYKRLDFTMSQYFIDREYLDYYDPRDNRSTQVTTAELSYVLDNILWGLTGPINGRRAKFSLSTGVNPFESNDVEYYAAEFDYRKYWHLKNSFSFALRLSGGASFGATPKQYFLGGTTNWIGDRTLEAKVYEVENLYFADVITPLRGVPYYELSGDRYGLINAEFRFPLIDYFAMRFPLPLVFSRVQGVLFTDIGAAWFGDNFKGGVSTGSTNYLRDIKVGFGTGMRLNLGFFLLRYDIAWGTDLNDVSDKARHYFSFGADF